MPQDRLSDQALLKLLDSDDDVSWLTAEEKSRMASLGRSDAGSMPLAVSHAPSSSKSFGERVWSGASEDIKAGAEGLARLTGVPGFIRNGPAGAIDDWAAMGSGFVQAHADRYAKAKAAEREGRTLDMVADSVAAAVPGVGPWLGSLKDMYDAGQGPEALGKLIVGAATPLVAKGAPAIVSTAAQSASRAAGATGRAASAAGRAVANSAREVASNPTLAALGAIEGYQVAGVPGAIAGGVGLPVGASGLRRAVSAGRSSEAAQRRSEAKAEKDLRLKERQEWQDILQHAKNLNAREKMLAKMASEAAEDLRIHKKMADRAKAAKSRDEVLQARREWQDIIQHAKNLDAREKMLAKMASEEATKARLRELFPNGPERSGAPSASTSSRITDPRTGATTTVTERFRPATDEAAVAVESASPTGKRSAMEQLQASLAPRLELNGIGDMAADTRELSRRLVLTPDEAKRLPVLMDRMRLSAKEAGLTYPAAQSPRRYVSGPRGETMIDPVGELARPLRSRK